MVVARPFCRASEAPVESTWASGLRAPLGRVVGKQDRKSESRSGDRTVGSNHWAPTYLPDKETPHRQLPTKHALWGVDLYLLQAPSRQRAQRSDGEKALIRGEAGLFRSRAKHLPNFDCFWVSGGGLEFFRG